MEGTVKPLLTRPKPREEPRTRRKNQDQPITRGKAPDLFNCIANLRPKGHLINDNKDINSTLYDPRDTLITLNKTQTQHKRLKRDYSLALKTNTIQKEGGNDKNQSHTNKNQIDLRENINKKLPSDLIPQLSQLIIKRAIADAYRHGITTKQGVLNPAKGDCAFEAVINNINSRNCYDEQLNDTANNYRI